MKNYELTYLSSLDISEKVKNFIQEEGGLFEKSIEPSQRKAGLLTSLEFSIDPEKLKNLEKKLKAEEQILRHMIITKKKVKKIPPQPQRSQAPQQPKIKKVELKEIDQKIDEILKE